MAPGTTLMRFREEWVGDSEDIEGDGVSDILPGETPALVGGGWGAVEVERGQRIAILGMGRVARTSCRFIAVVLLLHRSTMSHRRARERHPDVMLSTLHAPQRALGSLESGLDNLK